MLIPLERIEQQQTEATEKTVCGRRDKGDYERTERLMTEK
jgi:hypothetical protein